MKNKKKLNLMDAVAITVAVSGICGMIYAGCKDFEQKINKQRTFAASAIVLMGAGIICLINDDRQK